LSEEIGNKPELCWLMQRRSIRRYRPEAVPPPLVEQLLTAANWAPSAHNRQPWRLAVVAKEQTRIRLATAMGNRLRADLIADNLPVELIEKDVARSYQRLSQAPLIILLCLSLEEMDHYPDARRQRNEEIMAIQSVAMAGQNLLLAAHSLGLGACWLCAPLFCPDVVQTTLDLPPDWQPQGLITVGYPAESRQKRRQPLSTRLIYCT
jgi:coenzyme F420-0:L-glutamate ligase / coenzyme F420-1:gamma-L-glutamate ligase